MLHEDEFELDDDTRIVKWKCERDFTIIYNNCINDHRLSVDALSVLVYVMSKPDDWDIRVGEVSKRFTIGRNKTYSIIKALITFGYMKRIRRRNEDGSLGRTSTYASDRPMFLFAEQPIPENQDIVVIENNDKQPAPEIQSVVNDEFSDKQPRTVIRDMVVIENNDKQPRTGYQHVDNGYVDSLYTNKELNKENNNNKITTNPKGACATPPSDEVTNIYPEASVVVFFMKKIEGSGVPESTMVGWLRKHGTDYVAEKIRIYQSKGAMANPGGFLSSAIRYDWKDKAVAPVAQPEAKDSSLTDYPTLDENRVWFKHLSDSEKIGLEQLVIVKHPIFPEMLSSANPKLTVLDEGFPDSFLFKMMMELLGRAKR